MTNQQMADSLIARLPELVVVAERQTGGPLKWLSEYGMEVELIVWQWLSANGYEVDVTGEPNYGVSLRFLLIRQKPIVLSTPLKKEAVDEGKQTEAPKAGRASKLSSRRRDVDIQQLSSKAGETKSEQMVSDDENRKGD